MTKFEMPDYYNLSKNKPKEETLFERKCFICGKWNDNMKYFLDKKWYPQSDLKYNMNFLCDPKCATEAGKKYDRYLET